MAIGSKGLAPTDLDGMDNERLAEELSKAKAELFKLTQIGRASCRERV
mgnify:CR=1 FL=1